HRPAGPDLPPARCGRDRGHRRLHPVPAGRRGERGRAGQGAPGQDPRGRRRPGVAVSAADLLAVSKTTGGVTEAGLRSNISVALQYLAGWLGGTGAVTVFGQVEELATAEIARAQVWQWIK